MKFLKAILEDESGLSEPVWWALGVILAFLAFPALRGFIGLVGEAFQKLGESLNTASESAGGVLEKNAK